ncbi:MAG: hypothetical protein HY706_03365 [Candidatus Hydrogenedentes bacterium]|nr:hypothetical protein [Candidatus Hydrogenedentota bacterium]
MVSHLLSELAQGTPIQSWLILGPFVVRTNGHFEREYLYERERILDVDYLAADGGEAAVRPELGRQVENPGLGPKRLAWHACTVANLDGNRIAGDIIYETVQRNCVIYAAAVIESETACAALLDAVHSGMKVWRNGALVGNYPYGRAKGIRTTMPSTLVSLQPGRNLLLIKFRPGYIADGVDFCVRDVTVSPLVTRPGMPVALGRVRPLPYFAGSVKNPRQVLEAALVNTSAVAIDANVVLASDELYGDDRGQITCDPGSVTPLRLSLPTPPEMAGKPVRAKFRVSVDGQTIGVPLEYEAARPPEYDGSSLMLTAFHFDTTYHEEQRVYAMGAFDVVRRYCELHRKDPNFRSTLSEVDYLKPYFDMFPEDRETLLKVFRENRSNSDVMYNQPNEQNCGGEALVRNFLYGQLFHGRVLGQICHAYGPGDVFGHPNQLSQIARKSGCLGVTWDKYIFNFPPFFMHLALDGVGIPHKRGEATWEDAHAMGLSVTTGAISQDPPTEWHRVLVPRYRQATYRDLMTAIRRECEETGAHLPVTTRDMSLYHAATAMSRTELKIGNRLGENVLIAAEKFATLAALLGAKYPEKALDKAWRQILCGQHHDSITGTHNEISYVDLMNSYREVLELGTDVLHRSLDFLGRGIDTGKAKHPLVVFNSLAWERTDVVQVTVRPDGLKRFGLRDHLGHAIPFEVVSLERDAKGGVASAEVRFVARKLPSLGYRAYQIVADTKPLPELKLGNGTAIENEFFRIEVDPQRGGGIVSLYDKKAKREVINAKAGHVGNELAVLEEVADREETQHEFYTTGLKMFSGEYPARVEVERGPISATLRSRYDLNEICGVIQEITLYKGVKRLEFRTVLVDWQRENYLFCVTFPTTLKGAVPVFDERFGVVARNDSRGYLDFRTHQMVMFSDCGVYAANKWMEYGSSATLQLGRNKYALSMIGLITPKDAETLKVAEELQRVLIKKGITCTPWLSEGGPHWGSYVYHMDEDLLYTRFRLSLGVGRNNAYTQKMLRAQPVKVRKAFEQRLKERGFAYLCVKDGDLLDKKWPALPVLIVEANTVSSLEAAVHQMLETFPATAQIRLPGEVAATGESHTVDDYGVAILNEGTYANSVERGGTMCMMLAHTCRWYGGTNNFPEGYLVPEHKNHVFRYALYPHAGDWRAANTQRAGHEFNHPLLARETEPTGKASLPPEMAFLEVEPKNVILAAMKPSGNPIAAFEMRNTSDPAKGVTLRVYDTEGKDAEARIRFAGGIKSAWAANLLEERDSKLPVHDGALACDVPAFSIETVGFVPGPLGAKLGKAILGAEAEPVQPVWVRSWEHDAESMPMGYEPVVCSISREVKEEDDGRTLTLKFNAVNDYTDGPVSGSARMLVPSGWRVEPEEIRFNLEPLGHQITPVTVTRPGGGAAGQIKLRYDYDGQLFQDVLEIGGAFELEMEAEHHDDAIVVTLKNPTTDAVDAEVSMVTPLETWSRGTVGTYALLDIVPRTQGVSIPAGETARLTYSVKPAADRFIIDRASYWVVAKLMSNGRIRLKRCDRHPPRRLQSARQWRERLRIRARQHLGERV